MTSNMPHLPITSSRPLHPPFGPSSLSFLPNQDNGIIITSSSHSRPNWSSSTSSVKQKVQEGDVIVSDPKSASEMYRHKKLCSDFDLSDNSMRVAFRFVFACDEAGSVKHNSSDDKSTNTDDAGKKETIHLCWINASGTPYHFYNLKSTPNINEVTEDDHIETTYAGHAFVFCKKLSEDCCREIVKQATGRLEAGDAGMEKKGEIVVVNDECGTVFLKRTKDDDVVADDGSSESDGSEEDDDGSKRSDSSSGDYEGNKDEQKGENGSENENHGDEGSATSNKSESKSKDSSDEAGADSEEESIKPSDLEEVEWDAFLVVGGFRPGNEIKEAEHMKADDNDDAVDSSTKKNDNASQKSSADSEDEEWTMQLVTIVQKKIDDHATTEDAQTKPSPSLRGAQLSKNSQSNHLDYARRYHFSLTSQLTKLDPTPISTVTKFYLDQTLGGWPCKVEAGSIRQHKLRRRIESDLEAACARLPPHACQKLQQSTPIWINKSLSYGPKVAPIREANMCFHPGKSWLIRNGMNPAKRGGVEMYRARSYLDDCHLWGEGGLMLHELSHAWHYLHCKDGYDNADVIECYDAAMKEKLYDCVPFHCEKGKKDKQKAYACTNPMEYFAELSSAFFELGDNEFNKWYPFNRKQIKEHDPRAFGMLCRMWGVDEEYGKV